METPPTDQMTAAIFTGGTMGDAVEVAPAHLVVAADSGYDIARSRGVDVDVLVGDLDSISRSGMDHATSRGIPIERHQADKDSSDLELALEHAVAVGATDLTIYGGEGGHLDHLLVVALGLSSAAWRNVDLSWRFDAGSTHRALPNRPLDVPAHVGWRITLVPVGEATGVTTAGLRWELLDATLHRGTSLGLSNIATETDIHVSLDTGALLVIINEAEPS